MSNHRKFKNKLPGVILFQVVVLAFLSSCFQTYHLSNGEKYRNFFPIKDVYLVPDPELEKHKFDLDAYFNPDTTGIVQYVFPENINQIVDSIDHDLLLIFYYPNCSGADKEVEIAKFAQDNKIPFLLISDTYSPFRMRELNKKHGLSNRNQYIIPTLGKKNRIIRKKYIDFVRKLSPDFYDKQKDDLIFATVMKVTRDGTVTANPVLYGGFRKKEFLVDWIKQEFELPSE